MVREGVNVKATTSSTTESLLLSRASYAHSLSRVDDVLVSFQSYLRWMYVDQFNARHVVVFWPLFLLLSVFVPTASHSSRL